MDKENPIIIALDYSRPDEIPGEIFDIFTAHHPKAKINHAMSPEYWRATAEKIKNYGCDVFLDVKLHDAPNTVAMACKNYARWPIWGITVHISDVAMLEAAVGSMRDINPDVKIFGVPILSSVDMNDLARTGVVGTFDSVFMDRVDLAHECGLDGVVCSGKNVLNVTFTFEDLLILVPGVCIDPIEEMQPGQKRSTSLHSAIRYGADYVVLGRSLTESKDITKSYVHAGKIVADALGRTS